MSLIGGGAKSEAVRKLAPAILGVAIDVPDPGEYVALGAARQAAWVLASAESGATEPPTWTVSVPERYEAEPTPWIAERYGRVAAQVAGLKVD